jgi:hypothetical protein
MELKVTHITHLQSASIEPPNKVVLVCARKGNAPALNLCIEHEDLSAFIFHVLQAAGIARSQLGEPASPAMIPLSDVEISAAPSLRTVAIVLHVQGARLPFALDAAAARRAAESLLRHAAMIEPAGDLN